MSPAAPQHTFTVFTATHDRAHTLGRVRDSLAQQTFRDFEWLIVDDGSTDGTREQVTAWSAEASFPIRYVSQEHSGKHVAFNRGVREARGELFLSIDSDDALVPNALERFKHHWDGIPAERKAEFSAVSALCTDLRGRPLGARFPADVTDSDSLELFFRYKVSGDKIGFHRTDVLRAHPYPEPKGVRHVSPSVAWFAIARSYRTRYVNEYLLRVDRQEGAHLSHLSRASVAGRLVFHTTILNEYLDYLSRSPSRFVRSLVNYSRYSFLCGVGVSAQLARLDSARCKAALLGVTPLGWALSVRDARRLARPSDARPAAGTSGMPPNVAS
jgi:glycosyltransferase involved in cell wall biosynthesis